MILLNVLNKHFNCEKVVPRKHVRLPSTSELIVVVFFVVVLCPQCNFNLYSSVYFACMLTTLHFFLL